MSIIKKKEKETNEQGEMSLTDQELDMNQAMNSGAKEIEHFRKDALRPSFPKLLGKLFLSKKKRTILVKIQQGKKGGN